jgi:hypothetical protein
MRAVRRPLPTAVRLFLCAGWACAQQVLAAPFTPASDEQVLEHVPARATDPAAREMQALRDARRAQPQDLAVALRLARRYQAEVAATGDPRYMGYVQAALAPWWQLAEPPADVRVMRAVVLQFNHQFAPALADLQAVLAQDPNHRTALAWQLAIQMVLADYAGARASCERLQDLADPLFAAACQAQVDAATGQAAAAADALRTALNAAPQAPADQRLWCLTRLAESEERLGRAAAAQASFEQALALGVADVYLEAAHADFLLDQGRAAEVLRRLRDKGRADVLLLRLALAARTTGDAQATGYADTLQARFDAARLRGDTSHRKEEARALLALRGDATRSLVLARENWAEQREAADARVLLEAALAARDKLAAAPVLAWLADNRFQSQVLQALAARLKALP